jgi:hypothetical protein
MARLGAWSILDEFSGPDAASLLTMPTNLSLPTGSGSKTADTARQVAEGAQLYFGTLASIDAANLQRQLLRAQGKAAVATVKAGGVNAAETARAGLPSPSLILFGALAVAALVILKK